MSVDRTERILLFSLASFLLLLLVSQTIMLKEEWRPYLSRVDRLEGQDLSVVPQDREEMNVQPAVYSNFVCQGQTMTIRMIPANIQGVKLFINGKEETVFHDSDIKVSVYEGDYVEIDATKARDKVKFIVHVSSQKVVCPPDGLLLEGNGQVLTLGQVKFKK